MKATTRRNQAGFTLAELLVALVTGMVVVLGVTIMLVRFEGGRRTLTSMNSTSTGGAYASYMLDRTLRSAGSGFVQGWREALGCELRAMRAGAAVLPRPTNFPAPFTTVPTTLRLAPLIAFAGAGTDSSDVLMVATGASGLGEAPLRVLPGSSANSQLLIPATVGMRGNDLVLVAEEGMACMLQQVSPGFAGGADQLLTFGGTYAAAAMGGQQLADMGVTQTAWVSALGNTTGNLPSLRLLGVGANNTLVSHDVLRLDGTDAINPEADGVVDMRVRYGVDTNDDGILDNWVTPADAGWTAAELMAGTAAAQTQLRRIIAVQVGLVMRNPVLERNNVAPATLELFSSLPTALRHSHAISTANRLYRHRTVEVTVPLRNVLLMPRT
jgi:type IV pilus assembly protein PilW